MVGRTVKPLWWWPVYLFIAIVLLPGCDAAARPANSTSPLSSGEAAHVPAATPAPSLPVKQDEQVRTAPPPSPTAIPTTTATPTLTATATPRATATALPTATATPIGPCSQRIPEDDLLTILTLQYGVSRDYVPSDLVPLADQLPSSVTLGYPTEVRQVLLDPLVQMIRDMQSAGLKPMIISGYRSYAAQAIAWSKWVNTEPDRAAILSAPPGHSEHQLGTTLDFGSPELPGIVGDDDIEFHTYFYMTSESAWLREQAHEYGFTLSFPRQAFELTGFYYEPWHYRYVGVELATYLKDQDTFLTQYQFETQPVPCTP